MRNASRAIPIVFMSATVMSGCMIERSYEGADDLLPSRGREALGSYRPIQEVRDARVSGEVGPVALDARARSSAYDDGWYMSVENVVELQSRAAMTLLSVSNGADLFVPGLDETFHLEDYDATAAQVTLLGCVGQRAGVYDEYDMPADTVHIAIDAGAPRDAMPVVVTGRWYGHAETGERLDTFKEASTTFVLAR